MPENPVLFTETMDNPLCMLTDWGEHEKLTVGSHRRYGYNSTRVEGLIEILGGEGRIVTTAEGARKLAALLLRAADETDRELGA